MTLCYSSLLWGNEIIVYTTDNGHPERAFFQKFESFGLGHWAEILGCILVISSQTIGTILALWVPCSWESVAGSFSYKKCWFLGLKHTTPKYSQNKILAVKNLEKSLRTSVFSGILIIKEVRQNPNDFSSWRFLQKSNLRILFYYHETYFCSFFGGN